ncbi:tRNA N(3)-cytidine methyltransferase METTL8, mitochondrial isoform X1 [Takifugu rubripes]|uniref:tRNA N(3)-cytidine methyltransferase n=2 Tax=Takifugu rubripes TaxID=31033 RepID=A0A3B5KLH6_TAKRU|nr:methyltransferase-like protein 8 isoform X1 [Takifugu rubripes]|eukprot:XP_011608093.1 PREDICTED: methyltransferase-like protein 8 [Takifugu rubripes]
MHKLQSSSVVKLAQLYNTVSTRLKRTVGRPSAPLGSRILNSPDDIFKHNMWDHIQWSEEDIENARQKAEENSSIRIPLQEQSKFDLQAFQYWDKFYTMHQHKFFKDRRWLFLEFPELIPTGAEGQATDMCLPSASSINTKARQTEREDNQPNGPTHHQKHTSSEQNCFPRTEQEEDNNNLKTFPGQHASFRILEVGCGVGNSVFPIINSIKETDAFLFCCDFSPYAVQLVKAHPEYNESVCHAFVHDICEETACFPFPPQSLDVILAVFVLSAIHPDRLQGVVNRLSSYLKHGGIFLFRDYGRYDFSQLRFKKGQCLSENFYTRGDGTCVYFFTKDEIHYLFTKAGLEEVQNLQDRRLQVNRGKKVSMLRVWMQSKYRKPDPPQPS